MARIEISIVPIHEDGTVCTHTTPRAPHPPGSRCTGRAAYQAHCSQHGPVGKSSKRRGPAEEEQASHHAGHKAALTNAR